MSGTKALEAFFQKFRLIKANLEEAEAHKGPLTNAREILRDLRAMFIVAGARTVDYQIVVDGNTRLDNELREAVTKVAARDTELRKVNDLLREAKTRVSNHEVSYKRLWDANKKERAELQDKVNGKDLAIKTQHSVIKEMRTKIAARDAEVSSFTGTVTNLHAEIAAVQRRLRKLGE